MSGVPDPAPGPVVPDAADREILSRLATAPLEVLGRVASASNVTLLCRLLDRDDETLAVYKPVRGEAPLWDFPDGTLHLREIAAYVVSEGLGWRCVPPTASRDDGPLGGGSAQLFVPHDPGRHYFTLYEAGDDALQRQLARMVTFDLVVNNADRKASHVLADEDDHLWFVDHGVCFHVESKVRTVAWDLAGEPIPGDLRADAGRLSERLADPRDPTTCRLGELLSAAEVAATRRRAAAVATRDRFPPPTGERPFPWPPI